MKNVSLFDICRPKQWRTIATSQLKEKGYPVYGANGKIGFYNEYTHKEPTLMITCRGATCGNVHLSEPKSYINGNAMALDGLNTNIADIRYLYHYLLRRGFSDVVSGSAQPQITRQGLEKVTVPLPPLAEQKRIAAILDKADAIRKKRQQAIALLDDLLRSTFLDMFGDPVSNSKGWENSALESVVKRITDGEHLNPAFVEEGKPMVMANNVRESGVDLSCVKLVSLEDFKKFRKKCCPEKGDLLMVSRGATIGRSCMVGETGDFCLMGSVILVKPDVQKILPEYLCGCFSQENFMKKLTKTSGSSAQQAIYLKDLKEVRLPIPSLDAQHKYALIWRRVQESRPLLERSRDETLILFDSLVQRAFTGKL